MISRALTIAAGLAAGAGLAFAGIALAPDPAEVAPPTTVAADLPQPEPWWYDPSETALGPAVLLIDSLSVEGSEAVLRFEIRDIAPAALGRYRTNAEIGNPFFSTPEDPAVAPELWTLETLDGEIPGTTTGARVQTARFPIDENFLVSKITGLRIDQWRMRLPYVYEFSMDTSSDRPVRLDEDFTVTIGLVLAQADSVIVQLDLDQPSDLFTAGEAAPVRITGIGPEWLSTGPRSGGLQLVRSGSELPPTIDLVARTSYWIPFTSPIAVNIEGVVR